MQYPTFITTRDRLKNLDLLIGWLESIGQEEIYLVDNASTYPPLLEYFEGTPHTVLPVNGNLGNQSPWKCGFVERYAKDRYFVVTDPDVLPVEWCPDDAFDCFHHTLESKRQKYGAASRSVPRKVGFSIYAEDIPDYYHRKEMVERVRVQGQRPGRLIPSTGNAFYESGLDGFMAMYAPNQAHTQKAWRSVRHQARHISWYDDVANPDEDLAYYLANVNQDLVSWTRQKLAPGVIGAYNLAKKRQSR